jgi:hypothetical protein
MNCEHVFKAKGEFYQRKQWIFGGDLFTVVHYRQCVRCHKMERKVQMKKRVTGSADKYERQLRFSGIMPDNQIN